MVKQWIVLAIGYWCLYFVSKDLPTESMESFLSWLSQVIFDPTHFIRISLLLLTGIVSYSFVVSDILNKNDSSLLHFILFILSFVLSFVILISLDLVIAVFCLLCLFIYGMISLSQFRQDKTIKRQEGAG
ncbi:hypothetical protein [Pseudalkalibacillus decolorationis]|uniref:hypothetical protein n=1 Tax=Pseudalkalibacillus decolorationis TaxID=163879 RepID=UPI002149226A|nr:hypothetical protein [Pseudalkalibacillus decolorationis]